MNRRNHYVAILVSLLFILTVSVAAACPPDKVVICHATPADTAANGWNQIEVDKASIAKPNGHGTEHTADIIPPFEAGSNGDKKKDQWDAFAGLNWDSTGQAVWRNGCVKPEPTAPPSAPPSVPPSSPPSAPPSAPPTEPPPTVAPSASPTIPPPTERPETCRDRGDCPVPTPVVTPTPVPTPTPVVVQPTPKPKPVPTPPPTYTDG